MAAVAVRRTKLGSQGMEVSAQGLGCMGMSFMYGPPKPEQDMIELIHHAVSSGVTFLDTSDVYADNELLLAKALKGGWREKVQLATKFGISSKDGAPKTRGEPEYVREACERSLKRLEVDYIDLYYQHRIDTTVPIEVTFYALTQFRGWDLAIWFQNTSSWCAYYIAQNYVDEGWRWAILFLKATSMVMVILIVTRKLVTKVGALKELVKEGKIKYIGLSEASASTIRRAHAVHPITAVQMEWSLWSRDIEADIVPTCRELGIAIVPYSPLGRGFLSGGANLVANLADSDVRKKMPRFKPENVEHNKKIFERVHEMAQKKGCTPSQLALAWVHHQGNDVCPIPGTTKIENFNQNIGALSVKLTPEEMAELESYASSDAVKGDRHMYMATTWINSETPPLSSWKPE
ncbi:hypothetical protein RHSIM_Rhsim02G0056400 [Rhododendron simsii]|uniref:NADP-dependent oxidoreductase domain-containing protein n=1 Tax=Rhododendron simsii TaxID=118357 RepID=A0A834HCB8_RHOSS|nr:hypothetical protein RHSIM_Rhsim02G0056400 [Rhododendron simsii]